MLCVALSLVSIVAINSFRRDVQQSIVSDARGLHGGDVMIHSHYELSLALEQEVAKLLDEGEIQAVRTWEFYSVARREDGRESLFSNIKAVEKNYPLYGDVTLLSGDDFSSVLQPGKVIVAQALLDRLVLVLGDRLLLGECSLELSDVIGGESLRPFEFFNFGSRASRTASPKILIDKQKFPPQTALNVGTQVHTSPAQFGKVMADINPRMAVAYHFFNDYDTQPIVLEDIRNIYDGPLSLAVDYMVWNVTKEKITTRMAAIDEDIWPQPSVLGNRPPNPNDRIGFSEYIWDGRINYTEVLDKIYEDINKEYGTSVAVPKE